MASNKLKEAIELLYNKPMTIEEITQELNISRQTFYNWTTTGRFIKEELSWPARYFTISLEVDDLPQPANSGKRKVSIKNLPDDLVHIGRFSKEEISQAYTRTMQGEINFNFSEMLKEVDTPRKAARLRETVIQALHVAIYAEKLMKEGSLSE